MFSCVWNSEIFRSICFNDEVIDHKLFFHNLIGKLRERNWHPAKIRIIKDNCKMKYNFRKQYIYNIQRKLLRKKQIQLYNSTKYVFNFNNFLSNQEFKYIFDTLIKQKDERTILYFKKEANRFYDCDNGIRNACSKVINNLGISDVSIMVSNSINQKLGPKILYQQESIY